jgi:hypothetical protein
MCLSVLGTYQFFGITHRNLLILSRSFEAKDFPANRRNHYPNCSQEHEQSPSIPVPHLNELPVIWMCGLDVVYLMLPFALKDFQHIN